MSRACPSRRMFQELLARLLRLRLGTLLPLPPLAPLRVMEATLAADRSSTLPERTTSIICPICP